MGFRATPVTPTPRATILVDLNPDLDEILSRMRRSGRKAVRRSLRNGVAVREGTEADVATFCGLADATSPPGKK